MFWRDFIQAVIILAILFALNLIGFVAHDRKDMTQDQIHTLTPAFENLLENDLEHIAYVKVYLKGQFPSEIENLRRNIEEMLSEFHEISDGMVKYEFIDPEEDELLAKDLITQLEKAGLSVKMIRQQSEESVSDFYFWPGAIIEYGDSKTASVQFVQAATQSVSPRMLELATDQLEYNFMQAFRKLTRKTYPHVGFLEGHGELTENQTYAIRSHLTESYKVDQVSLTDSNGKELIYALDDYDAVVVAQPKEPFTEKEKFIMDQFIMNGGRVAWLIDPLRMEEDSLFRKGQTIALPYELDLEDLLYSYGALVRNELVISGGVMEGSGPMFNFQTNQPAEWPFYVLGRNTNRDPVAANLNPVRMAYASPVEAVGGDDISKRVLLETSSRTKVFKNPARVSLAYLDPMYAPKFTGSGVEKRTLALMLEGKFQSFYKASLDPAFKNNPDVEFKEASSRNKMLVVGDADFVKNYVRKAADPNQELNPERDILSADIEVMTKEKIYGNTDFFVNAFDDLMEQDNLVALRGRESKIRYLDTNVIGDRATKTVIKFVNIAVPLLILLIAGVILYIVRRVRYSKR